MEGRMDRSMDSRMDRSMDPRVDRSGPGSGDYNDRPPPMAPRRLSRQGSYGHDVERPQTLELPLTPRTPLRSSLKKASYNYAGSNMGRSSPRPGWGSSGGTPTNDRPTPPDSSDEVAGYPLSKTDSGFLSANKLVRFSPNPYGGIEKLTDWSPTGEGLGPPPRQQRQYSADSHSPPSPRPPRRPRQYSTDSPPSPLPPRSHTQYSADSPTRRIAAMQYQDFITENDLKKDFDFYSQ